MSALQRDLTVEQGATWAHGFGVTINSIAIADTWTVRSQVRASPRSTTVLHEWSTAIGNAAVADGAVTLSLDPAESSAWEWRAGSYDIEVTSPDGDVYRVASGTIRVNAEVTR